MLTRRIKYLNIFYFIFYLFFFYLGGTRFSNNCYRTYIFKALHANNFIKTNNKSLKNFNPATINII